MNRNLIAGLIANLFVAPVALAQSDFKLDGNVGLGGLYSSDSSTKDRAKLEEYQDLSNGAAGYFGLRGRSSTDFIDGYGENIGRDDMFVGFTGGRYNTFTYNLYSNWLTHNYGFGTATRTPYVNPGSANMTAPFPSFNTGVPPWTGYDASVERRDTGAGFGWQSLSPWYARVDFNQVRKDGNYLYAASNGSSPGNGFVDLAAPIDYRTNNLNLEGGYASRDIVASVSALWSKFDNENETFSWTNPFFGLAQDTTTAPPDNDFFKISANGVIRRLAWNSQLSARYTYSTTENSVPLLQQMLNTAAGGFAPITANTTVFDGKQKNTTIALAWTANPTRGLDSKVYYNFYDQKSESTHVQFNTSALNCTDFSAPSVIKPSVPCTSEPYDYTKNNYGFNLYYRLGPGNRLGGGWDYWDVDREGTNYDKTKTNTVWVEWSTQMIPESTLRAKYSYSRRRSDYLLANAGINGADPFFLERFSSQFDQQDRDQNLLKVTFDTSLAPMIDLGLEFVWQDNDYPGTTLGRTDDKRYGIFASLGIGDPRSWRGSLFADYEKVELNAYHRYINAGTCGGTGATATGPACFDPNQAPFPNAYNWNSSNKDDNWLLGGALSYPVSEQLKLTASLLYARNDGNADITAQVGNPLPINNYDTYKQTSLNLRADYRINKNWSLSGGYTYQKYDWNDDQYDNYQYLAPPPPAALNTSTSYLNGVYAFPSYRTNIVWLIGKYYFD
jgi:MtrB/PioB family decaheme-associated outer membrane protein